MKLRLTLSGLALLFVSLLSAQTNCANIIYVTPTGNPSGTGTISDPVTLGQALTLVTPARHQINLLAGNYNYSQTFTVPSNTVMDGRYEISGGEWRKNSSLATNLYVAAPLTSNLGVGHYIAVKLDGVNNVYIKDVTIVNITNASGTTNSKGRSNYGVHIANSNNFYITRSSAFSSSASSGANGITGAIGFVGSTGGAGHPGDNDDHNNCDDGGEPNSGRGGQGGGNGIFPPASANQCNGAVGNIGANGTNYRAGGNGGGGGSGERDDGAWARPGGRGGNGGGGAAGGTQGNFPGSFNDCSPHPGLTGWAGAPGASGANGTTVPFYTLGQYFIPGNQAQNGFDGAGGGGGGGGSGGPGQNDDGIFGCFSDDGSGAGGNGGGGGGQGGQGGTGGFGGGASFGIYAVSGNTGGNFINVIPGAGALGAGGSGGSGGFGGLGGLPSGGLGSLNCNQTVGEVGCGGPGGRGGNGGNGGAGANGQNGISIPIQGATVTAPGIPNPVTLTATMFGGCTNSEIIIAKSTGTWTLPAGASYINNLNQTTSSYNNTSATAITSFNAVGHYDMTVNGVAYTNYIYIRDTRALPIIDPSVPASACFGTSVSLFTPDAAAEYEWVIFEDGNTTATPIAIYSTQVANWTVPTTAGNTTYHIRLRERDDCCGWSVPVYHTIIGGDVANPIIAGCPSPINASTDPNLCGAFVSWTAPTATDDCASPMLTSTHFPGQLFPLGVTTVTYTATDAVGNTATCAFDVTVVDDVLPTITGCPGNINTVNDPNQCGAIVNWTVPTVSDNCVGVSLTASNNPGDFFPVGTTTVTYTATDANGNIQTCSFDVTVTDIGLPSFNNCPSNIAADNDAGNCTAAVSWTPPTAVGGCASLTVTSTHNPGDIFPVGTTTVTYTADDGLGNTATCGFDVVVTDAEAPLISGCPTDITLNNDPGMCSAVATWTAPVESDNCAGVGMTSTHNSGDIFPAGTTTVTYTATDGNGNMSTCSFNVTVIDTEAPVIAGCPSDITTMNDPANCTAMVTWTAPTESDNCAGVTMTSTHNPGDVFPTGTTTVTYTATDAIGNTTTCSFNVIVTDSELPVWSNCPAPITQNNDPGACNAIVNWTLPTVTDNCPGVVYTASHSPGATFPFGTTTVSYTATDIAGNTAVCAFDVTIVDVEPPVFVGCPGNNTVNNTPGVCGAIVSWTPPSASDNCAGLTVTSNYTPGSVLPIGTTTVTYTATDAQGNTATCSFDITVNDNQTPTFSNCPTSISVNNDPGMCTASVTWTAPTEMDNCPGVIVTSTHNPGDLFSAGTTTVTYTATDASGNTATCSFDVTVIDTEMPVLVNCPSNITVSNDAGNCDAVVTWTAPTATDNCPGVIITSTHTPGSTFGIGSTFVTYAATDTYGNQTTCSFEIMVYDTELPVITNCPVNDTVSSGPFCIAVVSDYSSMLTFSDNCPGATAVQSPAAGSLASGTTTITMTVTDAAGNVSTCSFDLVLEDLIAPSLSCIGDQIVPISSGCDYVVPDYTGSVAVADNCDNNPVVTQVPAPGSTVTGTQTVTITATDASNNSAVCTFTMTPDDQVAPVIACQGDISSCDPVVTFTMPTATDNCGNVTISQISGISSGASYPVGVTTNTFVATDDVGNTDTCSFNVTISPSPIVLAGYNVTIEAGQSVDLTPIVIGATSTYWSPAFDFSDPNALEATVSPDQTTWYVLTATNAMGCSTSDSVLVNVEIDTELTADDVDNIFTPNGDGKNDTWHVSTDLTGCNVSIYNDWGNEVFQSDNYMNDWGGTYKDNPLPEGVYYYLISCGGTKVAGSVTIIRMKK